MFVTGPNVIKQVTGEEITLEKLGGAKVHNEVSGTGDFLGESEQDAILQVRKLLTFLPSHNLESPPGSVIGLEEDPRRPQLCEMVPPDPKRPFDMREVIRCLVDQEDFLEVKANFARNVLIGFARIGGKVTGIVANQPLVYAGAITVDSSDKMARFIRFCDAFNIPLLFLVDTPAYLPGVEQEHRGLIRHGAKVLFALSEATVPRVSVIIRKVFGGGFPAMACDRNMGTDRVLAWPTAHWAIVGAEGAVEVLFKKELEKAMDREACKQKKIEEYKEFFYCPYYGAAQQRIDSVIDPQDTRREVFQAFEILSSKKDSRVWRKHGNLPL
jgi:propionyl-CoA carboxylase beta chain